MSSNEGFSSAARLKKVRGPWLAGGILSIALGVVLGVYIYFELTAEEQFLVVTEDVARGDILEREDIGITSLAGSGVNDVNLVRPGDGEEILGRRAITDLTPGTLVSSGLFSSSDPIEPDVALVGMNVSVGVYPQTNISVGDIFALVEVAGNLSDTAVVREVARVEIYSIRPLSDTRLFLTLVIPTEDAAVTSLVAASGTGYLVQVHPDAEQVLLNVRDIPESFFESLELDGEDGEDGEEGEAPAGGVDDAQALADSLIENMGDTEEFSTIQGDFVGYTNQQGELWAAVLGPDLPVPVSALEQVFDVVFVDTQADGEDERGAGTIPPELTELYLND